MHLYAPSNHVQNLRNEVIHTYFQTSIISGCKKEICICIKIRSLVITHCKRKIVVTTSGVVNKEV
jgi:hypothetical protein